MITVEELIERLKQHDPKSFVSVTVFMTQPVKVAPESVILKSVEDIENLDNSKQIYRFATLKDSKVTTRAEAEKGESNEKLN